jgi:hypothetical protein
MEQVPACLPAIFRIATLTDRFFRPTRWTPHATQGTALTHVHYYYYYYSVVQGYKKKFCAL